MSKRYLVLADGTIFEGQAFGADLETVGELVFNTGMTGYQEAITDQAYSGQLITFTYPLVGNTGINRDDYESITPACKGVVVYEWARRGSNWRNQMTLDDFLKAKNIPGICDLDTRALTRILRDRGTQTAYLVDDLGRLEALKAEFQEDLPVPTQAAYNLPGDGPRLVLVDYGVKQSLLKALTKAGYQVTVVPERTTAATILDLAPDGLVLSGGAGNPADREGAVALIQELQTKLPILGLGLGCQLLAMANGGAVTKLPFGHRGVSQAVREVATGQVFFTSQNHGYAVDAASLPAELILTHQHLNDQSLEGFQHSHLPLMGIQYDPDQAVFAAFDALVTKK